MLLILIYLKNHNNLLKKKKKTLILTLKESGIIDNKNYFRFKRNFRNKEYTTEVTRDIKSGFFILYF